MLSKAGVCSRSDAERRIREGRVTVNDRVITDPEFPIAAATVPRITLDGVAITAAAERLVIALNKPRGVVTTANDEKGRDTVYTALAGSGLPWMAPVGRLDKASEGLLLMSNDPQWAAQVTSPQFHLDKCYHVKVTALWDETHCRQMEQGVTVAGDKDLWTAKRARVLRRGTRSTWLEITLDEGRNRQIRRIVEAMGAEVERLVRVGIGALQLGELPKGQWRRLTVAEQDLLVPNKNP